MLTEGLTTRRVLAGFKMKILANLNAPKHPPRRWMIPTEGKTMSDAPMRCAECDCENGGADCNWIATPAAPQVSVKVKAYLVCNFQIARQPVKARGRFPEATEYLYPADRKDDAESMATLTRGDLVPLYAPAPAVDPLSDPRVVALVEAAKDVEGRFDLAAEQYHNTQRWDEEEQDGQTLYDWVFSPVRAALSAIEKETP
jgi:hypothetical protein